MKKIVLLPDSFKGTMSSKEICAIMSKQIRQNYPGAEIIPIPVADGGEGTVDAFLTALKGEKIPLTVKGPFGDDMESCYGIVNGDTAVIETAACAGLPLAGDNKRPDLTTTYGVGQMMTDAAKHGCKKIIVGLGGSCTNDCGAGAAAAAGIKFYDQAGRCFLPTGGTLSSVARIDASQICPELLNTKITAMCDIDNPLFGENGAAYIFAPQKGADPTMIRQLDENLAYFSAVIRRDLHRDVSTLPGAGAAGGMGAGMKAFFHAELRMGIETVLDTVNFDKLAENADLVISGEGKLDAQSLRGKVVVGIARRTKKLGVPLVAIVGDIGDNVESVYDEGVSAVFSINRVAVDFKEAQKRSKSDLALTMDNLMRFLHFLNF